MDTKIVSACTGVVGASIASLFGGWNEALITLFIFMGTDYLCGIVCAALFKKSKKTSSGKLSSAACLKGLVKKIGEMALVVIAARFDIITGSQYIKDATVIALIVYESISIIENLGLMGVPIPKIITKTIDVLKDEDKDV